MPIHAIALLPPDAPWAERLRRLGISQDWRQVWVRDWSELDRAAAAYRRGFVFLGPAALAGPPEKTRARFLRLRREAADYAVILLSPSPALSSELVGLALSCGVDDLLPITLPDRALAERIRGWGRRVSPGRGDSLGEHLCGGIKADSRGRRAFIRRAGGSWREVPLAAREFQLLCLFLQAPGAVFGRAAILGAVWTGREARVTPETVDKCVAALRRKLGPQGRRIRTVHGHGYQLDLA
jgi:DNA-binding response OmpR family regulator